MLSVANPDQDVYEEKKTLAKNGAQEAVMLSHAETRRLQDAARLKYKKAFDALKHK